MEPMLNDRIAAMEEVSTQGKVETRPKNEPDYLGKFQSDEWAKKRKGPADRQQPKIRVMAHFNGMLGFVGWL